MRITGDYGSGKSALVFSLLKAACGKGAEIPATLKLKKYKALTPFKKSYQSIRRLVSGVR